MALRPAAGSGRPPRTEYDGTETESDSDLAADLDTDGLTHGLNTAGGRAEYKQGHQSWFTDGPSTLEQVLQSSKSNVKALVDFARLHAPTVHAHLLSFVRGGAVFSSTFSGVGSFEVATGAAAEDLAEALEVPVEERGPIIHFSTTEYSKIASWALDAHGPLSRSRHRFGDVLDRCYPADLDELREIIDHAMQQGNIFRDRLKEGSINKEVAKTIFADLGDTVVNELCAKLDKMEFKLYLPCMECGKSCPASPRLDPDCCNLFWQEGSCLPRQPWSQMRSKFNWLDDNTLACLVFLYSARFYEPNSILTECTPTIDTALINKILTQASETTLKCPYASGVGSQAERCQAPATYANAESQVFSPVNMGIPSGTRRKYSKWDLGVGCAEKLDFQTIFFKKMNTNASVYLTSTTEEMVRAGLSTKRLKRVNQATGSSSCAVDIATEGNNAGLSNWLLGSLEGHLIKAINSKMCDKRGNDFKTACAIVNLSNTADFEKLVGDSRVKPLLKKSLLYDLVSKRPLLLSEYWLIQGFPHPSHAASGNLPPGLVARFPCAAAVLDGPEALSDCDQKIILGNSMHLSAISAWVLYSIATFRPGHVEVHCDDS